MFSRNPSATGFQAIFLNIIKTFHNFSTGRLEYDTRLKMLPNLTNTTQEEHK